MPTCHTQVEPFRAFVEVIVSGDSEAAIRLLNASPHLAKERAARGATRQASMENFFDRIKHYINEGDTALHVAAANQTRIAEELISRGADVRARNRRGAEPLHYAVDGGPDSGGIPTRRPWSLPGSFGPAPTRTLLIRAGSLHCTARCVIDVLPR